MNISALSGHEVANVDEVASPALLLYPHRVQENIRRLLAFVGGDATRLRPHVKTHKLGAIVRMQLDAGIAKFKCATIAEAEMTADAGAPDVLLAYQMVGPNVARICTLAKRFPETRISVLIDNSESLQALSQAASAAMIKLGAFVDIDCGMHRSGIEPGDTARQLFRELSNSPGIEARGLHAYDGHIHDEAKAVRSARSDVAMAPIEKFRSELLAEGLPGPTVVAGGTPTFPMHVQRPWVECSPGTCLLNDAGYGTAYADMEFVPAAFLLTRVISKPGGNRLCLDLGHNPIDNRVRFPDLPDAVPLSQSEEHLVIATHRANEFRVGDVFYGLPWHICPTLALYSEAAIVSAEGEVTGRWPILARARSITV